MRLSRNITLTNQQEFGFKIPEGFCLCQDTREQQPLFDSTVVIPGLTVINVGLTYGDYSVKGFEDRFVVERKSLGDFFQYIGKQHQATTRKMQEFRELASQGAFVGLAIEAAEPDLLSGYIMSQVTPEMVRQALVSFEVRYGVHVYYSRSRQDITRWILDRAIKFYRIQREVKS